MSHIYLCPDDFWRCPIDLNHRVLAKRFQYHIRRCMTANPHIRRVRCVFNANHLTTPNDLLEHMSTCPDAINTSTVLIGLSDGLSGRSCPDDSRRSSAPTDWQMFHDVNATEDWDDDIRERQARQKAKKEQMLSSTSVEKSLTEVHMTSQHLSEERQVTRMTTTEQSSTKHNSKASAIVNKQAHVLKEYDNDGLIHPVETDELTKSLVKIRALQLIGGVGRGHCCLIRTTLPGYSP